MKPNRELNSPRVDVMMHARINLFVGTVYHGDKIQGAVLASPDTLFLCTLLSVWLLCDQ